jgi:hypothetical protein
MQNRASFVIYLFRFHEGIKSSIFTQLSLLQTFITLSRYMCIFWLKDPSAFQDDFWTYFLNIWIAGVSYISQFIFIYMPGKQSINFYLFSGINPDDDDDQPRKINISILVILIASIIVHLFVNIRIFFYKIKAKSIVSEQNFSTQSKNMFIKTLENQNLADFTIFTGYLIGCGSLGVLVTKLSRLEPWELNKYPNYLMIYWMNLVNSLLLSLLLGGLCYYKHHTMRQMMTREIKELLRL